MTRPRKDLETVRELRDQNLPVAEIARRAGIPRGTVRTWLTDGLEESISSRIHDSQKCGPCDFCYYVRNLSETSYAYLLGLYLGDGCIAAHAKGVYRLRIVQDNKYPNLIHQCAIAMRWVVPSKIGYVPKIGWTEISSYSKHWPCLFPQHGPGRKHERLIALEPWQRRVAIEREPRLLLRGLIHSDGCRANNWARVRGKRYEYPRYQFSNRSEDIRSVFTDACDRAGIAWRQSNSCTISVAQRASVELMDQFIGPKS